MADHINDSFFQVSVKGLHFNDKGKLLMIQEDTGEWELPGGRIQKGEGLTECLKRECFEETGIECEVLESQPSIVFPAIDKEGRGRMVVCFKIKFKNFDFKPSNECRKMEFFNKKEIE